MTKYDFIKNIVEDKITIEIPVQDFEGNEIGYLKPITKISVQNDSTIVADLTAWRNTASKHFFTTFTATEERTKIWLFNQVLNRNDKLLFLIHSMSEAVGHLGFANYKGDTAELDNLIRGVSGGHPELILLSEYALIDWMFRELDISSISAQVLFRNIMAMLLHKKVGFEIKDKIYLKEIVNGNEGKFIKTREDEIDERIFAYIIQLTKDEFYETYSRQKYGINEFKN